MHVDLIPAFGLASPWLLLGLGLAAVPIIVHLLFRRPHREIPWAATRFLLNATKKHAKRLRLEQLILLAVRVAVLMLVAFALARPYWDTPELAVGAQPPRHRVVLLDASYSMSHESGGRSRFDIAKDAIREVIQDAVAGDAFHLVRMTDLGQRVVIGRAAFQAAHVAATLDEQTPSFGRADPIQALRAVRPLFDQVPSVPLKELLIVSDFQQSDWRTSGERGAELRDLLEKLGRIATVRLIDVGRPDDTNRSVSEFVSDSRFVPTGRSVRFTVAIDHHGETDRDRVELLVDGRLVATETVELRRDERATVTFSHVFAEPGSHALEVRIPGDGLAADDSRYLAVSARNRLRVLLVNGRPAGRPEGTATFFIRQALAPAVSSSADPGSDFEPVVIDEGRLADEQLTEYDAVVLSNVPLLTPPEARRLRSFAAAGGGIVVALGDNARLDAYNRLFGEGDENPLLSVRLADRVGEPAAPTQAIQFDPSDLEHPIVRPFAGNPGTGLDTDFVLAYAKATLTDEADTRVALRFDTGDPAIVTSAVGAGRIVLVTTSFDTTWGGPWPQAGRSFLPLVHELVRFAATGRPAAHAARVGEPITWTIPQRIAGIEATVTGPGESNETVPALLRDDGTEVVYAETRRPGVYSVSLPAPIDRSAAFAFNVDVAESDLTPLSDEERTVLSPQAATVVTRSTSGRVGLEHSRWNFSRWLLSLALGLLLAEQVLAWRFAWGLVALAAVGWLLIARAAWLADPLWGAIVLAIGIVAASAAVIRTWRSRSSR